MEAPNVRPPPLPPKSRRSPPATASSSSDATVLTNCIIQDDYNQNLRFSNSLSNDTKTHVVKIQINPSQDTFINGSSNNHMNSSSTTNVTCVVQPCIKISVNTSSSPTDIGEMVQNNNDKRTVDNSTESNSYFYYDHLISSGQVSPSDTLDSGTCSDLDGTPTPPSNISSRKSASPGISVTIIGEQTKRQLQLSSLNSTSSNEIDSDDNESSTNSYYDSPLIINNNFPHSLLRDIRNVKLSSTVDNIDNMIIENNDEIGKEDTKKKLSFKSDENGFYETDVYYNFHLNEHDFSEAIVHEDVKNVETDETFAGYKDLLLVGDGSSTIRSSKGTVRGVKNRVRAGIATFLQISSNIKNYKEKEAGKVVVYTTTMGIIRDTYQACTKVKQILRTLLVKFEERDVFMSGEYQEEIKERMKCDFILIPQVFVDGQHVGDAETIEKLNESGELRRIMKPFKSLDACSTCKVCGGYRLLPCTVCNGSKKSVHRNHFTTEFVALKCMNCDEVGLIKCTAC